MSERACVQAVRARMQRREIEEDAMQGSKTLAHNLSLTHFTKKLVSPVEKGSNTGRVQRLGEAGVTQSLRTTLFCSVRPTCVMCEREHEVVA